MSSPSLAVVPSLLDVCVALLNVILRRILITEQVERGIAHKGNEVELVGMGDSFKTTLTGIGEYHSCLLGAFILKSCLRNVP